jgi:hypothetical protein
MITEYRLKNAARGSQHKTGRFTLLRTTAAPPVLGPQEQRSDILFYKFCDLPKLRMLGSPEKLK